MVHSPDSSSSSTLAILPQQDTKGLVFHFQAWSFEKDPCSQSITHNTEMAGAVRQHLESRKDTKGCFIVQEGSVDFRKKYKAVAVSVG